MGINALESEATSIILIILSVFNDNNKEQTKRNFTRTDSTSHRNILSIDKSTEYEGKNIEKDQRKRYYMDKALLLSPFFDIGKSHNHFLTMSLRI